MFSIILLLLNINGFAKDISQITVIECDNEINKYSANENKLFKDDTFPKEFTVHLYSTSKEVAILSNGKEQKGTLLNRDSNLAIFTTHLKEKDKSYLFFYFFNNKTIIFGDVSNLSAINTIEDILKLGNFYTSICSYSITKK